MMKILISLVMLSCISQLFGQPFPFETDINTVGLWHFNEASGLTAYDSSGNILDGTLENGVSWDSLGMFESCLMFNANYQRVRVTDTPILDMSTDLTIEAWIKLDSTNNGSMIISKWHTSTANPKGQYSLGISSTNKLFCYFGNDTSQFTINSDSILIEFDEWTLVSAVFSNGNAGLFINGIQAVGSEVPFDSLTTLDYPHDDLFIGDLWTDQYYPYSFDGKIDEVRISNIARYQIVILDIEESNKNILPLTPSLEQNYPNPFNPSTKISFQMAEAGFISLKVYDVLGNEVATLVSEEKPVGEYEVEFSASGGGNELTSGIYFYQLRVYPAGYGARSYVETKKMILIK